MILHTWLIIATMWCVTLAPWTGFHVVKFHRSKVCHFGLLPVISSTLLLDINDAIGVERAGLCHVATCFTTWCVGLGV